LRLLLITFWSEPRFIIVSLVALAASPGTPRHLLLNLSTYLLDVRDHTSPIVGGRRLGRSCRYWTTASWDASSSRWPLQINIFLSLPLIIESCRCLCSILRGCRRVPNIRVLFVCTLLLSIIFWFRQIDLMVNILAGKWISVILIIITIIHIHWNITFRRSVVELERRHSSKSVTRKSITRHFRRRSHLNILIRSNDINWDMFIVSWLDLLLRCSYQGSSRNLAKDRV